MLCAPSHAAAGGLPAGEGGGNLKHAAQREYAASRGPPARAGVPLVRVHACASVHMYTVCVLPQWVCFPGKLELERADVPTSPLRHDACYHCCGFVSLTSSQSPIESQAILYVAFADVNVDRAWTS